MSKAAAALELLIHVVEGPITYRILEPFSETVLASDREDVVRPEQPHEFQFLGPARLFVEFLALPAA
jgi:hypothetical protein